MAGATIVKPNSNKNLNQNFNQNTEKTLQHPPSLKEFQKTPSSLGGGLEQHIKMIRFKLDHLADSQIADDKRAVVQADLEAELVWAEAMVVRVAAAESQEAQAELKEEIKAHLLEVRRQRQEKLSQQAELPTTSPYDKAEEIGQHFAVIVEQLKTQGLDTAELEQGVSAYNQMVEDGQVGFSRVTEEKSFEHVKDLRDQLQAMREQGLLVRNLIQSILTSNPAN